MEHTRIDVAALSILAGLVEPVLRVLVLAVVARAALMLFRVRRTQVKLYVWTIVLMAALGMPALDYAMPRLPLRVLPATTLEAKPATPHDLASSGMRGGDLSVRKEELSQTRPQRADLKARSVEQPERSPLPLETTLQSSTRSQPAIGSSWPLALFVVYLLGALALLVRAVVGWVATRRFAGMTTSIDDAVMRARLTTFASNAGLAHTPQLAESAACVVPITMGIVRPAVVLPIEWREWSDRTLDAVLIHELSHVARRDALTQSLSLVHRAIFWFSPLGWWLHGHLVQLAEYASDEAVLAGGVDQTTYAEALLGFFTALGADHRRAEWSALHASGGHVAMAQGSGPERRVERILAWTPARSHRLTMAIAVVIAVAATPAVAIVAAIQPAHMTIELPAVTPLPSRFADVFVADVSMSDPRTTVKPRRIDHATDAQAPRAERRPDPPEAGALPQAVVLPPSRTPTPPPQENTDGLTMVRVEVRDAAGRFVPDLSREDFELREGGAVQPIASLGLRSGGRFVNLSSQTMNAADTATGRLFVIFVDDANIPFTETPVLRDLLHRVTRTLLHQGDLVTMVSTWRPSIEVQQTYDLNRIDREISNIAGGGMTPQEAMAARDADTSALRERTTHGFAVAIDMLKQLASVTGKRKAFIWISSGYVVPRAEADATPAASTTTAGDSLQAMMDQVGSLARQSGTAVYVIDPRGINSRLTSVGGSAEWQNYVANTQVSPQTIASLTGGAVVTNVNGSFIASSGEDYYVLGYRSSAPAGTAPTAIDVQVKRPGLTVKIFR